MDTKTAYISFLENQFQELKKLNLRDLVAEHLISPFTVHAHPQIFDQVKQTISSIYKMREMPEYQSKYSEALKTLNILDPLNKSIMMSYDFHIDEHNQIKLIEINTNAAFLILGYYMYQAFHKALPVSDFKIEKIKTSIETELKLQNKNITSSLNIAIIDDNPSSQRLFLEFLVCNELFKTWGWKSHIQDYRDITLNSNLDFIYNRHTDFYLNQPESVILKKLFLDKSVCLSPNPNEYFLLADKQRMIDWSSPGFLDSLPLTEHDKYIIKQALPETFDMGNVSEEFVWAQRKRLFFKPKRAFGSKQSYKGASMSKKAFESILGPEFLAQEYVPAPEKTFETPEGSQTFKYDLRCYAYQGELQLIVARLYQGQVTNLKTPWGGFAPVEFSL